MQYNEKPFSYRSRNGTSFKARCDFRQGVIVTDAPKARELAMADVAEMIGYHCTNILPNLNGFQGYDCVYFQYGN